MNAPQKMGDRDSRRFTVLGASGFIGSYLVDHLRSQGHEVLEAGRDIPGLYGRSLGNLVYAIGVTADFRTRPFDTMDVHVSVLSDILQHARFESFTYLSSTRVYDGEPTSDESTAVRVNPADPSDLYNLSKLAGEALCLAHPSQTVRIARLSNVFGNPHSVTPSSSQNFLDAIFESAVKNRCVVLRTSLDSTKDYVAIDDVCHALARIALDGTERLYNVAAGHNTTHDEIMQALTAQTGCTVKVEPDAERIAYPTIRTSRLSLLFKNTGRDWSPASLLDRLPDLLSGEQPEPLTAAGGRP